MSITLGNPIIVTSGTLQTLATDQNIKVREFYWLQPDLGSTSSLIIRKHNASGQIYAQMQPEVSGQTQVVKVKMWVDNLFVDCMPSGTLFIYLH